VLTPRTPTPPGSGQGRGRETARLGRGRQTTSSHLHTQLGGYKCPKSLDFVEALPSNPSGKIL